MNYSTNSEIKNNLQVSIGLPVYNGEQFIRKRIECLLNQTISDFELIISDNASTDSTSDICNEYLKKDKRIHYIKQKKNMGPLWNLNFVLGEAKSDYFVWAAVDDIWESNFLEKNLEILKANKNVVCSMSKTKFYGNSNNSKDEINKAFRNFTRKLKESLKPVDTISLKGSYEQKVRLCLKRSKMHPIYGVFRTDALRHGIVTNQFVGNDLAMILNVLKHGDFHIVDQVLMSIYDGGSSKKGIISFSREFNHGVLGTIFPMQPVTRWCQKNLGTKLFLKNLDYFILLNLWGGFSILVDIVRIFLHGISRK